MREICKVKMNGGGANGGLGRSGQLLAAAADSTDEMIELRGNKPIVCSTKQNLQSNEETSNNGRESTGGAVRLDQKVFGNSTDDAEAKEDRFET